MLYRYKIKKLLDKNTKTNSTCITIYFSTKHDMPCLTLQYEKHNSTIQIQCNTFIVFLINSVIVILMSCNLTSMLSNFTDL